MRLRQVLLMLSLMLLVSRVEAQDWCGKTIPGGASVTTSITTTLHQSQNCTGRTGIRMPAYSQLDLNGYAVFGATGACIRSVGTKYIAVRNGLVQNCGSDGIDLQTVTRPSLTNLSVNANVGSGLRCLACSRMTATDMFANNNTQNGVKIEQGSGNTLSRVSTHYNGYGVRLILTNGVILHDGIQSANRTTDVSFEQETHDSRAYGGSRGTVTFQAGTFNNWATHYVTCRDESNAGQCG